MNAPALRIRAAPRSLSARGAEVRLARALERAAAAAGLIALVEEHRVRPWTSATFEGAYHDLVLAAPRAPALGGWLCGLAQTELPVCGHLVAALGLERIEDDGVTVRAALSVLLLAD